MAVTCRSGFEVLRATLRLTKSPGVPRGRGAPRPLTHLEAELERSLQVGPQVFRRRVCDLHQGLEHRVVGLVTGLVHHLGSHRNGEETKRVGTVEGRVQGDGHVFAY